MVDCKKIDVLDMNNYKIERMPTRPRSSLETWMMRIGAPLAAIAFVWIYWFASIPFLDTFDVTALTGDAIKRFETLEKAGFHESTMRCWRYLWHR